MLSTRNDDTVPGGRSLGATIQGFGTASEILTGYIVVKQMS